MVVIVIDLMREGERPSGVVGALNIAQFSKPACAFIHHEILNGVQCHSVVRAVWPLKASAKNTTGKLSDTPGASPCGWWRSTLGQ